MIDLVVKFVNKIIRFITHLNKKGIVEIMFSFLKEVRRTK